MNPRQIDDMSWAMAEVYASVTDRILVNLAKYFPYIKDGKEPKNLFDYQARMLAQVGKVNRETAQIIMDSLGGADEVLRENLEAAIMDALKSEDPVLQKAAEQGFLMGGGMVPPDLAPNQTRAFQAYYRQSADKLNLVNTVMLESTQAAYTATVADVTNKINRTQSIMNTASGEVVSGVSSLNEAVRDAVDQMVKNGITGFVDHGGHRWSPEAYVAMDTRTTLANTARAAVWEEDDRYGVDMYQVSHHDGARPLCYPWQGKVISRNGFTGTVKDGDGNTITVHSQDEIESFNYGGGLFGVNCGHYPISFIPGFSRSRPPEQNEEENRKEYEASQQQRGLERKLREERRDLAVLKAQGAPQEMINAQSEKVKQANHELDSFCDETGRARRKSREGTPIKASFPDPDTYNKEDFPTDQRDRMTDFFRGQTGRGAAYSAKRISYDFGGDKATITEEGQEIIKGTIERLQKQYPIPEGYTLEVSDFRARRGLGFDEDLEDMLDRLEVETKDNFYGVKAQFMPIGTDRKTLCIEFIDTTLPNYSPKERVFDEIHQVMVRNPNGKPFNVGWGYECDTIHEYGHALSHVYRFYGSEDPEFVSWYMSLDKEQVKNQLSTYAATNWNEFFAEAFLQSFSPYQSDLSKQAMDYLRKKMTEK